jgi:hypothetical protein
MLIRAAISLALLLPTAASATLVRVPLDQPDLATALDVAADGDTVAIAATHAVAGGVVVPGRSLVISGGWNADFTARTGRSDVSAGDDAPSLTIAPPTTGSPVLEFLAIAAGDGLARSEPLPGRYGGGVLVLGGAPELRDLVITGGDLGTGSELGCGAGLALLDSDAVVSDCALSQNRATWGGAVFVQGGAPTLRDLEVTDNTCNADAAGQVAMGAGVLVRESDATFESCAVRGGRAAVRGGGFAWLGSRGRTLTLRDCELSDNTADQDGGGLYGEQGIVEIDGGSFLGNGAAPGADFLSGGGAYVTAARVDVVGVEFVANQAAAGGALTVNFGPEVVVRDCVFRGNEASLFGAALNYQSNDAGEIAGNTAAANVNPQDAGTVNLVNASPLVARNLIAFNAGGGLGATGGAPAFTCNDVFGNDGVAWVGVTDPTGQDGNLAVDPLFCDLPAGDLSLRDDSPCLDAPGCGRIGARDVGCSAGVGVADAQAALAIAAYPNPANPRVTLRFTLPTAGAVRLAVHDARGRRVRTLLSADLQAGEHAVRWNGRDDAGRVLPTGVYLYRLEDHAAHATGRVTLLR